MRAEQSFLRAGRSLPRQLEAFHWHGDTFALLPGALHLASSAACANQAFQIGERALGLKFHLGTTHEAVEALLAHCSNELDGSAFEQSPKAIRADPGIFQRLNEHTRTLLVAFEQSFS